MKVSATVVLSLLMAILMTVSAGAQLAGTGAVTGIVTDSTGAVIPNATVMAISVDTNAKTVRTTTSAGDYNITPLTPGTYTITVAAKGFQELIQKNIVVDALVTVTVDLKLAVGAADQSITVDTAPPVLDTADAALGAVMDNEMYSALPLQMGQGGNADQRRATDFAYLMPGVQSTFVGSGNSTDASGSVNGGNPAGGVSEIYIEGINLPEADGIGDPRFTWTAIGVDAVNQFQVQTAGYSAQYAGQGVQNYSLKQGGNQYHGSIYEYLRNTVLDAWKFTSKVPTLNSAGVIVPGGIKPTEIQNEYGIVLSGPIVKNKLFMFYNYGQYRDQNGPSIKAQTLPTLAMLGLTSTGQPLGYADFSGYAAATGYHIYDPATQTPGCAGTAASPCVRTQFKGLINGVPTNDVIPGGGSSQPNRISPAANYINKFMLPYEAITNQSAYANNIDYGYSSGLSNWYQTGRLDYNQSTKHQISLIIAFGRQASTGPNASGAANQLGPPFNTSQSYTPKTTVDILRDTYTITPHLVNQFAVAFGRYKSLSVTPNDASIYNAASTGLTGLPVGQASNGFPGISFGTGGVDNPSTEGGYDWNQKVNNTYTTTDNAQWVHGKNNITAGGQLVFVQFNYEKNISLSSPMTYTFTNGQTEGYTATNNGATAITASGSSVASYMLGAVNTSSVTYGVPELGSRWRNPSFWLQDDYKVNDKLTFNVGVRWDIFPSVHEAHNIFSFLNPTGANSVTGNLGTLEFAGNGSAPLYCNCANPSPTWYKNIAPRLGVAFAVNPKTVLRASYDIAFARGDWTSGSQNGSPSTTGFAPSASAPAGISAAPQFYWDNAPCAAGTNDSVSCGWTGAITAPAPPAGGTSLAEFGTTETAALTNAGAQTMTYFDHYLGSRTPEYINYTYGISREITKDMSATVTYVGSQGHFINVSKAIGSRNNELPESLAALAGYNIAGTTATPCSGLACTAPLLGQKATASNLALAAAQGFTPPNPYNSSNATYYASNSVYQYYQPFPQFSAVSDTTSFVGNENWNALEITVKQRAAHGVSFMINYTYSKSVDDLGTFRVGDNQRLDRSLSAGDQPQNLTGTVVYLSPFGKGKMFADNKLVSAIAGGWSVSGILVYHSGIPILFTGSGCGGSGILNQCMPSIVQGQSSRIQGSYGKASGYNTATTYSTAATATSNGAQYLNPAAFTVATNATTSTATPISQVTGVGAGPQLYVPGNAARTAALNTWGPGLYDIDLGVKRVFPIYETWQFQFEADFLNATNHVVFAAPNSTVNGGGTFGTITGGLANSPRDIQVSARLSF